MAAEPVEAQPAKRKPGRPRLLEPSADFVARRDDIVAAAAEVFHAKGYDAGTLDDVAEALDLRRASLYYYVRSKPHLLSMIVQRSLDLALAQVDGLMKIENPTARLEAVIRHHARMVAEEPSLFTVFFDNRSRLEEKYEAAVSERETKYFKVLGDAVKGAGAAGSIDGDNAFYATRAIFGMTTWCYKWFDPERHDIDAFIDACVSLVFGFEGHRNGQGALKGRRAPTGA